MTSLNVAAHQIAGASFIIIGDWGMRMVGLSVIGRLGSPDLIVLKAKTRLTIDGLDAAKDVIIDAC